MTVSEIIAAIGILLSIYATYTAGKAKAATKVIALEKENLKLKLDKFTDSIERVNERLDETFGGQALITHDLNGEKGFYARIAILEERCKDL